ncbi:MAG TPA: hypothetical protein VLV83_21410 [Acidobacteriota bacterium]|nr:hypothetical protein [Acidobacteriota bacterium]
MIKSEGKLAPLTLANSVDGHSSLVLGYSMCTIHAKHELFFSCPLHAPREPPVQVQKQTFSEKPSKSQPKELPDHIQTFESEINSLNQLTESQALTCLFFPNGIDFAQANIKSTKNIDCNLTLLTFSNSGSGTLLFTDTCIDQVDLWKVLDC